MQATPFFGGPYRRSYGPILQSCVTISWVPLRFFRGLKVAFGDHLIRVYGNTAVNTGYYTFSYVQNGESKTFPARYSFTYVKDGDRWMIVDHHSSAMPSLPK
jgi:hypothetical protein